MPGKRYGTCAWKDFPLILIINYKLEGKGPDGERDPDLKVLVDIDNLIDYMIIIFYTGNIDAPVSKYLGAGGEGNGNSIPNNFFAVYNRNNRDKGFVFFAIDSELTLIVDPVFENHMGLLENRVNIGRLTDESWRMEVNSFDKFHPQWLHFKLSKNAKYRKRFSERVKMHMTENGAITEQKCVDRFMARANEINYAIIMESARWGDSRTENHENPRTKADWQKTVDDIVNLFFIGTGPLGARNGIVIKQLDRELLHKLYRDLGFINLLLSE